MAAITICSDFGAQKHKAWHCFHCLPIYFPWSDTLSKTLLLLDDRKNSFLWDYCCIGSRVLFQEDSPNVTLWLSAQSHKACHIFYTWLVQWKRLQSLEFSINQQYFQLIEDKAELYSEPLTKELVHFRCSVYAY